MPQQIHCLVNNCQYWGQGNTCKAKEIMVTSDEFGAQQSNRIDATMATQLDATPAGSCMATCCTTFVPKGSGMTDRDSIKRMT